MPRPQSVTEQAGALAIPGRLAIVWTGCHELRLDRAAERFQRDLGRLTGIETFAAAGPRLDIACRAAEPGALALGAREAYRLQVDERGVRLEADGPIGVLRGLATLRQLLETAPDGSAALPFVEIDDKPRFAWRGVMIDTARHFMTVGTLKRQIDAMEQVKLNVLHLHLSDNEAFRVESRRYPRLHGIAAQGQFYTQAQIRHLVAYAADRGVRVVPEFDVPGHTRAIILAYPQLASHPVGPGAAGAQVLNPASEETYRFVTRLFDEMAGLFPDDYFHIGGDEVGDDAWAGDPAVEALKAARGLKTKAEVEAHFHRRIHQALTRRGKIVVGWEEVIDTGTLPRDVVVQAWRTSNATARATAQGHRTIVSAGYYLDLLNTAAFHYGFDPLDTSTAGMSPADAEAARKLHPLVAHFVTDGIVVRPAPPLSPAQEALVLGGEAPIWAELVSDEMLDSRLWPRAAALAERFWSPRDVRDVDDMYARLAVQQDRLRRLGLNDRELRARMASRLAPGDTGPLLAFLDLVGPVRNMAHDKRVPAALRGEKAVQHLTAAADAAPVDSLVARGFAARARRLVAGDRGLAPQVRAELQAWIVNDARLQAQAAANPSIREVLPVSAEIAGLATAGLAALDALEAGKPLAADAAERGRSAIARAEASEAASARPIFAFFGKRPPGDLIITVTPGLRALIEAAASP
ncbi:MAG: beta-N-acetylhexosaminidase [Phenylobacterium sp.]|uniref:beta-N-acetylhexosaminidase n=1 Tax=Phenylobacterium sp. TaxID=1871053 RepID=UPI001A633359|nr:family 20 glycosylhydrolase [Phenylobacterium sp.]MBL8553978.1 beta-N-acetylhexosaminidase [Phenylobacterium sp.]